MVFRNLRLVYRHSQLTVALRESRSPIVIHGYLAQSIGLMSDSQFCNMESQFIALGELAVRRLGSVLSPRYKPQYMLSWLNARQARNSATEVRRRLFSLWLTELRVLGVTDDRVFKLRTAIYQTLCDHIKRVI